MAKRMLADVLWEAANVHLPADDAAVNDPCRWSCNAALAAEAGPVFFYEYSAAGRGLARMRDESSVLQFLASLGATPGLAADLCQGVRYMWLLLAMHVAEDEGLTV